MAMLFGRWRMYPPWASTGPRRARTPQSRDALPTGTSMSMSVPAADSGAGHHSAGGNAPAMKCVPRSGRGGPDRRYVPATVSVLVGVRVASAYSARHPQRAGVSRSQSSSWACPVFPESSVIATVGDFCVSSSRWVIC